MICTRFLGLPSETVVKEIIEDAYGIPDCSRVRNGNESPETSSYWNESFIGRVVALSGCFFEIGSATLFNENILYTICLRENSG